MESSFHHLPELFRQLGLPDDQAAIESFIATHRPLPMEIELAEASFWSTTQRAFLCEQIARDADWAEVVDVLSARLR